MRTTSDRQVDDADPVGHPNRFGPLGEAPTESASSNPFRLVPSVEPGVVFTSLAAQCVPELCDDCIIDIVDRAAGADARYRIVRPPGADRGGMLRIATRAAATPAHRLRVRFDFPPPDELPRTPGTTSVTPDGFRGRAVFVWHRRPPTRNDRSLATTLVSEAVRTVLWQCTEQAARIAVADAAELKTALRTSRDIGAAVGIVMSRQDLNKDQAYGLLRTASRRGNRTLRDLALEVIEARGLDPTLLSDTSW